MTPSPPNVTEPLRNWSDGAKQAQEKLFQVVYDELHRQAPRYLRHEQPDLSLQTTDLIHEAYLRRTNQQHVEWQNRLHFFAIVAKVMRHILVDHVSGRQAAKRGGTAIRLPLEDAMVVLPGQDLDLFALD
jgi:RNA polymerase sigma factor (TIGR02999 family)